MLFVVLSVHDTIKGAYTLCASIPFMHLHCTTKAYLRPAQRHSRGSQTSRPAGQQQHLALDCIDLHTINQDSPNAVAVERVQAALQQHISQGTVKMHGPRQKQSSVLLTVGVGGSPCVEGDFPCDPTYIHCIHPHTCMAPLHPCHFLHLTSLRMVLRDWHQRKLNIQTSYFVQGLACTWLCFDLKPGRV